ncbi:MAG: Na+/H+ antiporter subunit D [Phycisphaeraceae bacterium]|nr:Na+/H+ antiporter subunit D [Phycisphaeraceae bacterium]MCW5753224.1 Na+/H+ antiporter subunit D [Phycisphaeraceae bacterium]
MTLLPVLPILIPLCTACLGMLFYRSLRLQQWVSLFGAGALLVVSILLLVIVHRDGMIAVHSGSWAAPFGITLVADLFGAIMVLLGAITAAAVVVYSIASVDSIRKQYLYHPLVHVLMAGVCGAFLTGDIFNLYVCFEVLLLSSFVLLALGSERGQLEGAIKYVTLNLFSSAVFLSAVGILYGAVGTLNMADLSLKVAQAAQEGRDGPLTVVAMMFMIAFGIKSAVFPLFFWLPASYHTPPFAVSALFAGLLTKVGVYAMIRVFTLIFTHDVGFTHSILLWVAALTMITGVLGAASQGEFRRILSFHIVSQIGYMILGLALFTPLAIAGSIFYIMHHIIVKANLFLVAGVAHLIRGTSDLGRPGIVGVYASAPIVALLFMIPAMSLAGVPPLSGFWAKLILLRAAVDERAFLYVAIALLVGIMTLFSMTKIWAEAFWKSPGESADNENSHDDAPPAKPPRTPFTMLAPIAAMALLTVLIGLGAQPVFELAQRVTDDLLTPSRYIHTVLGSPDAAPSGDAP